MMIIDLCMDYVHVLLVSHNLMYGILWFG